MVTTARHCTSSLHCIRQTLLYDVVHEPVHSARQDSTIIQNTHRTKSIVTEIACVYIHSTQHITVVYYIR